MIYRWLIVLLLLASPLVAQSKRPFTFEDMMALKRVADPVISPDGKWVLFSVTDVNLAENTRKPHLWVVPIAGGDAKQITNGVPGESRGRFSPDGRRIAFLTARDGGQQIWIQDFDSVNGALSGEPIRLTNLSTEADGHLWSPDGKHMVFVSEVYPDCKDEACNKARDEAFAASKVKARTYERLMFRHWNKWEDGKRSHIFVVPVDGSAPPRDLTPGDHDAPPFSLGGQDFYSISPDGQELAYTTNLEPQEAISTNNDVFLIPLSGGAARKISASPGSDSHPIYSADGRYIAYRMQERNGFESDRFQLVLYDHKSGTRKNLTPTFDRWVGTIAFAPDSKHVYFSAEDQLQSPLFRVSVDGGEVERVVEGFNDDPLLTPDGKALVFTRQSTQFPNEIFTAQLQSGKTGEPSALTHINDGVLSQVHTSPVQPFWFVGAQATKVQGFIITPPGFDKAKKYPVKFLVHGGPQSMWGNSWTYRWNAQLFAADGYVAVLINPRGSTGYGQKFINEIRGDWGGKAYIDLMRGMDHVESTMPFVDKNRVCVLGASYGGYMVNWIIGQTNRFKCAVSHDGTFNPESQWGTTEELFFKEMEFLGPPWVSREVYRRWSPALQAPKFRTPTLVVHGQLDYRIDLSEGLQMFTTLQRLGVPSKFLYIPDEGHWVLKPQNSGHWYKTVNGWVDQWIKGQATTGAQ